MSAQHDPVAIVEAAYDAIDATRDAWLTAIAEGARSLDAGLGVAVAEFDASSPRVGLLGLGVSGAIPPSLAHGGHELFAAMPDDVVRPMCAFGADFGTLRSPYTRLALVPGTGALSSFGATDGFGIVGVNASKKGVMLTVLTRVERDRRFAPLAQWRRAAAHLTTAVRLRRTRAKTPDAVMLPDGRLLHAELDAQSTQPREALAAAARRIDRARTRKERSDPSRALALWTALVRGRWSLVDTIERDGKRLLVAHRNETPGVRAPALTPREAQIVALVGGGRSNKEIAYELGIGASTVETLVLRARRKLGVQTRAALAAWDGSRAT